MKIVFFDIDGTLLDDEKKLPASTKAAIKELQENGTFVAIATGRAPFMFDYIREELDIDTFVSYNGQYVVFENQVIYRNPLSESQLGQLHKEAANHNNTPMVFMTEKTMKASVQHHERIETAMGSLHFPHPEKDETFYLGREIYQSLLFCKEEEQKLYDGQYDKFRFIRWHDDCIDVLPKGGSKAEGIRVLMDKAGFKLEDVYAFGDGLNDVEMLETAGHGIAMGNAVDEVKKYADYVTDHVAADGIYNGLKYFELI
ncbi:Cof-type HAD-IIB family hydrolase [Peribacillus cavernae]|uniref:Cof-type HAD-IIB family hydrolase n=1 Tax=Peribacillus cavernae TaxID=1674310 RepID=A0A3S0U532_9BACI|nr:Cof-type HAD-IIB family hydrolase [Peribacillus cavernae]MDQ0217253.1 Cof subfamily protein (haloacid dehalogenase superfamily) [Peribacillus cavernae]RUQ30278.1 Cof-type HAD-IIB family hydrolase [Peribacillus cavernae]